MALNNFCAQLEGFGPISSLRTLDFTPCFEDIVLSLIPNVILIIVAIPRTIYLLRKSSRITKKTWLYWAKIITITILAILKAILIVLWTIANPISQSAITSNVISLVAVLALLCLSHLEHFRTLRPSPFLLSYLLLTIITDAVQVRTYTFVGLVGDIRFAIFVASLAVRVMVFAFENIEKRNLLQEAWMKSEKFAPESTANWFSKLSFSWILPLMNTGTRKYLEMDDLWDLDIKMKSQVLSQKMQKHWDEQKIDGRSPSIYVALFKTFGTTFFMAMIPRLIYSALNLTKPTLISEMIVFIDSYSNQTLDYTVDVPISPQPAYVGYGLVVAIFLVSLLGSIVNAMFNHMTVSLGVKVRGALVAMIYRKSLRVRTNGLGQNWKGEVVNHMSSDVEKLLNVFNLLHSFWAGAVEIAVASWLLYNQVSLATFAAFGVLILSFTLAALFSPFFAKWQRTKMKRMGERIQKMTEMVANMKSVKLNGYEPYFTKRITDARVTEVVALKAFWRWASYYAAVTNSAGFFLPLVTIGTYAGMTMHGGYGTLDVRRIFTVITLIQLIRAPLFLIGSAFTTVVGSKVSFSRIEEFLKKDDIDPDNVIRKEPSDCTMDERIAANDTFTEKRSDSIKSIEDAAIEIENASFSWNVSENEFKLEDINLRVPKGTTMAIVGQIGQGKSSLIESIVGETFKLGGTVTVTGLVAYVPQVAWILNTTVRENIVFGRPWDEAWYWKVVNACSLDSDFGILSHGDMTLIGEKGINLSGGQKQRVSIARAVYSKADIYLFDDPLSALDAHVDQQVFSNIIGSSGLLATKTRLLVTHAIHHLPNVDYIVTLKQGRIVERGTYTELMADRGEFYTLISENLKHDSGSTSSQDSTLTEATGQQAEQDDEKNRLDAKASKPKAIESEVKNRGKVPFSVYSFYLKAAGYDGIVMMIIAFILGTSLNVGQQLWLNYWGEYNVARPNEMVGYFIGIYSVLNIGSFAAISISISLLLVVVVPKASKRMHNWELNPVIRSPMGFFDTTSAGKIINRFTTDLTSVDFEIPTNFVNFTAAFMQIIGAIIMTCLATPWFTILLVPLAFFYWLGQRYYLVSSREIRRLDSAAKSPLYSHCGETLGGLSSVRAYGDQIRFGEQNIKLLDESQRVAYIRYAIQRWLQMLLDLLGTSIIVSLSLIAVLTRNTTSAGLVGVALANTINITAEIDDLMKNYANLEQAVVAVERIKEFSELKPEGRDVIPDSKLSPSWPARGEITFENYSTQYREDLDLALKNISFSVLPGEKIGIVGRTGAGKSSITMALLRIIEPVTGKILIDNENICEVGLQDLRSRISIIPQDPFLWGTTMRENLDPYSKHTDEEIWSVLESTGLKDIVSLFDEKLDHVVQNGGENFSLGQRQLFCLCRVLLRGTRVIIMDEATAAIDVETDNKIQRTIREKLKNCTVLTIAHRIGTIMDSDRILVLDRGEIAEFSSPESLLAKKESVFYGLALQAGQVSSSSS